MNKSVSSESAALRSVLGTIGTPGNRSCVCWRRSSASRMHARCRGDVVSVSTESSGHDKPGLEEAAAGTAEAVHCWRAVAFNHLRLDTTAKRRTRDFRQASADPASGVLKGTILELHPVAVPVGRAVDPCPRSSSSSKWQRSFLSPSCCRLVSAASEQLPCRALTAWVCRSVPAANHSLQQGRAAAQALAAQRLITGRDLVDGNRPGKGGSC